MPKSRDESDKAARLRAAAEIRLRERGDGKLTPDSRLVHELEVHQIELEMQNEELRGARRELEMALSNYTELFDFSPIGYAAIAPDEKIREINHAGAKLLARNRKSVIGTAFGVYVVLEDRQMLHVTIGRALASQEPATCEVVVRQPTGSVLSVRATCVRLARSEPVILVAFEDITAQKAAERALKEADQRKDEFIATLSHELRNPLAPIRTGVYLLGQAEAGSALARKTLAIIERQVTHMTRLIDDLLDVTRITRGKIELHRAPIELGEIVRRVADDHAASFTADRVWLDSDVTDQPVWVDGDAARIVQVLTNLLSNAQKFTPPSGTVTIALERVADDAVLRVRDTGNGVSPHLLDRVFEPFTQAPQTIERSRGGLGLGLAMSKGIIELHGGTIALASKGPGSGTEVTVTLPLVAPAAHAAVVAPTRHVEPRRVLVIEDSVDLADSLRSAIELEGHQVEIAYDGPNGLARAHAFHPDVVLCDLGLPGMDGLEIARTLRADRELHDVFLVALSGYARPEDRLRTADAGFDRHVAKPPDLAALQRLIGEGHRATAPGH
jgi:two-component system CheB/CheR fusion protein